MFDSKLPHPTKSNIVLEAICSGVGLITDRPDFIETYQDIVALNSGQVMLVSPSEITSFSETITKWIREQSSVKQIPHQLVSYQDYLLSTEKIYENSLNY